ncbi:MAG: hypothetical protein HKN56_06535, partial [Gammaproteobacteria bacterium]|nr:hypothetical protein [Gammaproteobacteria bacterium]
MRIKSLLRQWRTLVGLLLVSSIWAAASAAPNPPPLLCVDDDADLECVETPETSQPPPAPQPPPSTGGDYDLSDALAGVPFTVNTPVLPNISEEVTVTPSTIAANKVNGRRLILQPGNYGNQSFGTQDQEIVIQPGVEIGTLSIDRTARRLHFRATPVRSGRIRTITTGGSNNNGITDLFFEGLYVNDNGSPSANNFHGARIAIINSHIIASEYAVGGFHGVTDFILANSHAHTDSNGGGNESNMRSHSPVRYVVVDSRLQKSGLSKKHTLRIHAGPPGDRPADDIYIARNQLDGSRVAIRGTGTCGAENGQPDACETAGLGTVWFDNNVIYQPGFNNASLYTGSPAHDTDRPQMMYVRNNSLYT